MKTIATLAGALFGYLKDLRDAFLEEFYGEATYGPLAVLGPIDKQASPEPLFSCPICSETLICCDALADADNHQEHR